MAIDARKYEHEAGAMLRDVRPLATRFGDALATKEYSSMVFVGAGGFIYLSPWGVLFADVIMLTLLLFFWWLKTRDKSLAFKLPIDAKFMDPKNGRNGKPGKPEGIMYLGNVEKTNEESWFTNSDVRTHILYLGTTGAGKTEGLKSMVTNALSWGSGFVYVDGKADTDLWSSLSSLVRRFGRDDDLLVLNYMTGNSDAAAPSNTMNPFSSGSASYLTNMLVSLMPDSQGDNAMWSERAISLVSALMPILTWKRDNQELPLSVTILRDTLSMNRVIRLARDEAVPIDLRSGVIGYLDTLPGFIGDAYDDNGDVKPPGPDTPQYDTTTANQQHGYLAMQFTRSLQSLGDDYGYIFDTQAADVDMVDVVLNRRILIVLIHALEKSGDEIANLGKIVAATIKGMMGSALGSSVEGSSATVIENKPTHSNTPFMTVFDEVGYYTAEGMAVMAAQARSLGFCLVFSGQDLPAMKKRVREEADSIVANCNIKIFGKLEDPTETKEFFEKTVGSALVTEVSGFQMAGGSEFGSYFDTQQAGIQSRPRADYEGLRAFKEGQAVVTFGDTVVDCAMFYSNPGFAKAMRVTRYLALPPPDDELIKHANNITRLRDLMVNKSWTAKRTEVAVETPAEITAISEGIEKGRKAGATSVEQSIMALVELHALNNPIEELTPAAPAATAPAAAQPPQTTTTPATAAKPAAPVTPATPPPAAAPPPTDTAKAAGPMGFFGKKDDASASTPPAAPVTPPAAPPPVQKTPPAPPQTPPQQHATPPPAAPPATPQKTELPKEIRDIIETAGEEQSKKIFKGEKKDDEKQ
jgi:intracellular multiplication protein IcmO